MANKSVLELAVETGRWDSGLKKAKSALDKFTDSSGGLQKALDADSEKMSKFVQMMGKADSTAKTGKGQMNDYKQTIEQLTMQFNRMTDAQKKTVGQDYLKAIDQLKEKYRGVSEEIQEMNRSLSQSTQSGGGGLLSGLGGKMEGALAVFGGNLMTKAAGMASSFASELGQAVQQGIELARQGEGIRNAFERLGRGDILDGLREATHGTVTDLELMKAAVKFNDFNLPLEELGTMLAFAQQKAKDTGQSVDYMVDSIVTGLGRKSLMILDNLGLSATQIKDKMAETGDMSKAVGEIIREQMANAGEYIETAADRAAQADVELKNAMEELGRTLMPLEEQGTSMWKSLETGAINLLNDGVKPLVPVVMELKTEVSDLYSTVSNSSVFSGLVDWLQASWEWCSNLIPMVRALRNTMSGNDLASGAGIGGALAQVAGGGNQLPEVVVKPPRISGGGGGRGGRGGVRNTPPKKSPLELLQDRTNRVDYSQFYTAAANRGEEIPLPFKPTIVKQSPEELKAELDAMYPTDNPYELPVKPVIKDTKKDMQEFQKAAGLAAQAVSSIGDAFAGIEDPTAKAAGMVMQAIASIALGFATASTNANTAGTGWGWLAWLAAGAAAMATTISTIHSLTGFENGGEIKGNSYSGDNIPIMANAGEVVLTRAMAGNLASQLEGAATNVHVTGEVHGTKLVLVMNRALKVAGKGEIVTWK